MKRLRWWILAVVLLTALLGWWWSTRPRELKLVGVYPLTGDGGLSNLNGDTFAIIGGQVTAYDFTGRKLWSIPRVILPMWQEWNSADNQTYVYALHSDKPVLQIWHQGMLQGTLALPTWGLLKGWKNGTFPFQVMPLDEGRVYVAASTKEQGRLYLIKGARITARFYGQPLQGNTHITSDGDGFFLYRNGTIDFFRISQTGENLAYTHVATPLPHGGIYSNYTFGTHADLWLQPGYVVTPQQVIPIPKAITSHTVADFTSCGETQAISTTDVPQSAFPDTVHIWTPRTGVLWTVPLAGFWDGYASANGQYALSTTRIMPPALLVKLAGFAGHPEWIYPVTRQSILQQVTKPLAPPLRLVIYQQPGTVCAETSRKIVIDSSLGLHYRDTDGHQHVYFLSTFRLSDDGHNLYTLGYNNGQHALFHFAW